MRDTYDYNHIVFCINDSRLPKLNPDGYQTLSLKDLANHDDVHLIPYPLHHLPYIFRYCYFVCNSRKFKKLFGQSIKNLFYPYFFDKKFVSDKPLCFILIGGANLPVSYLHYLKKTYPNCKIVFFFRDLVSVRKKLSPDIVHDSSIDIEMSFDEGEAEKYGMHFCCEYSSVIDLSEHNNYPCCDVFFCGQAKDRYERLLQYYHYLTSKGLKCDFYITEVPESQQVKLDGIHYNQYMSYKEMLYRSYNAKCLLDINQLEASGGYTSRFYEAIMYNRKLISDNPITCDSKFYNGIDIIYVTKPEDVTQKYIDNINSKVDYHYSGEFSPFRMIETVEKILKEHK